MTTKTICVLCEHPISEHTYSENFTGCDQENCNCPLDMGAYIDKLSFDISFLRAELTDAKERAKLAEANWHANEARNAKLVEAIKAAQIQLHATQRNWDEECLFECNDILTAALTGSA